MAFSQVWQLGIPLQLEATMGKMKTGHNTQEKARNNQLDNNTDKRWN